MNEHIAFLIPGVDKIGGAESQVISLANGLANRGWRTSLVALTGTGGAAARELLSKDVDFLSLHMCKGIADPRGWVALRRWIRDKRPDVLHAHLPHATWMGRGVRILGPVRLLLDTVHTSATGTLSRRLGYAVTAVFSDRVTAVSQATAHACVRAGMTKPERVVVLPNGIDVRRWNPDRVVRNRVRRELGVNDEFIWFTAGRLEAVKDYPTMLLAFAGLGGSSHLVVAGAGSQEGALRTLIHSLELQDRVHLLGFQADIRPWMQAADAFVLSSLWEGLPVCLLEAGACGLPCVATNVAGTREVVEDGETGFLATPQSAASLATAMGRLMGLPLQSRDALGEAARDRVVDLFSLEKVLDRWEALYRELLRLNPVPGRYARPLPGLTVQQLLASGSATGAGAGVPLR